MKTRERKIVTTQINSFKIHSKFEWVMLEEWFEPEVKWVLLKL